MEVQSSSNPLPSCPGCAQRDRRIAELEARIQKLEQQLASLSASAKRQAAPFSKGPPKADPKPPGRKSGPGYGSHHRRAIPSPAQVDETYDAKLPRRCPYCGEGSVLLEHVDRQYQVEIPRKPVYRLFRVQVGQCRNCHKRVQGRHELQTSDALGAAASQIGPEAQAAVVLLNKTLGLSHGKIERFFESLFGIDVSRGGCCRIMLRSAAAQQASYQAILQRVRGSTRAVPDETGWRIGGQGAWLHAVASDQAVAYLIAAERGFEASRRILGQNYAGTLTHDGWSPYWKFWQAEHQLCLGHLLRRCEQLLETARGGAVIFPRKVKLILQDSLTVRDQREAGTLTLKQSLAAANALQRRLEKVVEPVKRHVGNERFAFHLWQHRRDWFTFLRQEAVDATNWRAEQAIRPAVVNRKVWGGNRTQAGAEAQSILMSVLQTLKLQGQRCLEFLSHSLRSPPQQRPLLFPAT